MSLAKQLFYHLYGRHACSGCYR